MAYYVTNENSFLDIKNAHLRVTGNVHTDVLKVGSIGFQPAGSNISGTVNFTNVTTGVTTSSNLDVGGTLNLGTIELSASTHTLDHITARGNVTSNTIQFENATTGLVTTANVEVGGELTVSSNIEVAGFVGSSGTGALTLPSGTTGVRPTGVTGMIRFNSSSTRLELYNGTAWQSVGGASATQTAGSGTTTTNDGYQIHAFTSSGTFTVISGGFMDILIVAGGGGGGGGANSGGGGAGGVLLARDLSIGSGSYAIVVGSGGTAPYSNGTNGSSSSFGAYSANGGGGGADYQTNGLTGGNGGGAGADDRNTTRSGGGVTTGSTPPGFTKYGHSGGGGINGTSNNRAGGGGGGAGGAGGQANGSTAGSGGAGIDLSAIFGTNLGESGYFASGGHGQSRQNASSIYAGPVGGGGGNGSSRAGLPNTGGGGHGGYMNEAANTGGGGSGIVIIRYLL